MASRAALLVFVSLANSATGQIVELTKSTFDYHIRDNKQTLVQFHAPWCGHCKKLMPEYEKAASQLKESKGIALAKVDATVEKSIATKYNVKGFPTLIWFEDGRETPYDGGKTAETIVEWVVSMVGIPVTETSSLPAMDGAKPLVVLSGPSLLTGYESAAKRNRRTATWYFMKTGGSPKIEVHHKGEQPAVYSGNCDDPLKVSDFANENILPLFGSLDADSWDKYMESGKGMVWTLFDEKDVGSTRRAMMTDVAIANKGTFLVTYSDIQTHKEPIDNMLSVTEFPAIAVQKKAGDKHKYVYTGDMTADKIKQFIKDVEAGRVAPRLKSEPVPVQDDKAAVRAVVSTTFEREVFSPVKDTLLFISAPWCGHCKKLDPEYQKLADKIQNEEFSKYFTIAKMDGTLNDSPVLDGSFDWTGFPSLFFVRATQRAHMLYEGERTAKGLWKYMRRHATNAAEITEMIEKRKAAQKRASEL